MNCAQLAAETVVRVAADVVELVHGNQATVEGFHAQLIHGKAEGGMGAHQHLIAAGQELANRLHLGLRYARLVHARRIAQVPLRLDRPIGPEAVLGQFLAGKAATDGTLGHNNDGLFDALIVELVQRDEHQGA